MKIERQNSFSATNDEKARPLQQTAKHLARLVSRLTREGMGGSFTCSFRAERRQWLRPSQLCQRTIFRMLIEKVKFRFPNDS